MSLTNFPIQQFYEALMTTNGLQEKLQGIIAQFKKKNIQMIYQTISHIHQILISKLQPPLMKFNALMSTKIFFDLCEYPSTVLIEIYILPIIFQIAVFKTTKKSDQGVSLYFIQRGSKPTKQIKKIGFNYVLLAIEFIFASAQIKAFRVLQNQELQEQSNYKKISKALIMRGVSKVDKYNYYNQSYFQEAKKNYFQKLKIFSPQNFVDFFKEVMQKQLKGQTKPQLDSKRLIMFGDVFITSPLINLIEEQFNDIIDSFQQKKKYLLLLNQLVRFGFIQAIFLLNNCDFLLSIASEIAKVNGDKDLDEGRYIYPIIDDNPKAKKAFYLQFLRCIETWSYAIPYNQNNDESDSKRIADFLKYQKKFKFPQNRDIHKFKSQMELYLKQNSERNQKVVGLIQQRTNQQYSKHKISSLASLKGQSKVSSKKGKDFKKIDIKSIQDIIIDSMQILQVIGYSQKSYQKDMNKLSQFKNNWKTTIENANKQGCNQQNLQILISQGEIVVQQIKSLQQIYNEFINKKIDFIKAQQKIDNILNSINYDKNEKQLKSQISVVSKYTVKTINGKRDIASKISQAVKKQRDLTNSRYSQFSASISAKSNTQKKKQNIFIKDKQNEQKRKRLQFSPKNKKQQEKQIKNMCQQQFNVNQYGISSGKKKGIKQSFLSPRQSQSEAELKKKVKTKNPIKYFQDNVSQVDDDINYSRAQFAKIQKQSNSSSVSSVKNQTKKKSILKKNVSSLKKSEQINQKKQHNSFQSQQKESSRNKKLNIISFNEGNSGFLIGSENEYGLKQKIDSKTKQLILQSKIIKNNSSEQEKNSNINITKKLEKISKMEKMYTSKEISKISQKDKQYLSFTNIDLSESRQDKNKTNMNQIIFQREQENSKINNCPIKDLIQQQNQQNQMLESYYTNQLQQKNIQNIQFKEVANINRQLFHRKQNINFQSLNMKKIQTSKGKSSKKNNRETTIMATLSQKNAKKSIQVYHLQRQKNKIIEGLNLKIRNLQNQERSFHNKLLKNSNSMKSISFKQYSERDRLKFKVENTQSNQCSFSNSSREINMSRQITKNMIETIEFNNIYQQSKEINGQQYEEFLIDIEDYNIRKNLLKSKCLLLSNEQLQIGCMSIRKENLINFTLFITPKKYCIEDLQLSFQNDHNISISALPDKLYVVKVKKQETINIKILVQNIPYKIPKVILSYKIAEIKNTIFQQKVIIPCSFNKICSFQQISSQKFKEMFTYKDIYMIKNFKMSNKIFKQDKVKQIFPYFVLLKKSQGKKQYGCEANYNGNIFLLKFTINEKIYCRIEAKNMTGQKKNIKFLQYLTATFKKILQSNKL